MSKNKKAGRPKLPDREKRDTVFPLRMTAGEHRILTKAAAKAELPLSEWARNHLLSKAKAG
jgi:predicted HicB family RNase H-like nuclease